MKVVYYSDLDLDFIQHPTTNDVSKLRNAAAIKRAVRNLVLTTYYDAPFQPTKGNFAAGALFENDIFETQKFVENEIVKMIDAYEPRVQDVNVRADYLAEQNTLQVDIEFSVIGQIEVVNFTIILQRTR